MEQSEQRMQQSYERGKHGQTYRQAPQPDFAFETNMTMIDHVNVAQS